jgi:Zn-dependent peptidase ImmA (M78 family)
MIIPFIEQKAEKLLKESQLMSAPVDVFKCAEFSKVDVQPVVFDDDTISGLFVIKDKLAFIRYNQNDNELRQRFTVAHELGHFFLHSKETPLFLDTTEKVMYRNIESSTGDKAKEREANAFAAALLMPKMMIISEASKWNEDPSKDIVAELANQFKVSQQAMNFRLLNLGLLEFGLF